MGPCRSGERNVEATALGLEINVWGAPQEVERSCGFLRGLLGKTHAPLIVKRRDGLTAEAKPAAISDPIMTPRYALLSATLTIPSGVWRGPLEGWEADTLVGEHNVSSLEGGSRPVTDALVLVTGPAQNLRITNVATGAVLIYSGSIPAGQKLLVEDVAAWRATLGADVSWDSAGADATRNVDGTGPRSATHLWTLTPPATPAGTPHGPVSRCPQPAPRTPRACSSGRAHPTCRRPSCSSVSPPMTRVPGSFCG